MKTVIQPDKQKAESLKQMARITLQRLESTEVEKYPSNTLTDYYDILHKLMEAITYAKGIKFKGEGAHQQLIDYIRDNGCINDSTAIFIQGMRTFRNRIAYEGFMVNKDYIKTNKQKITKIIDLLLERLENK